MGDVLLSVVIPARNAGHLVGRCLRAVIDDTESGLRHGLDYEIIVVDNGSTDDTAAVAAGEGATVVVEAKRGAAAARNAGIAAARGDIICVTDADCRPTPGWLGAVSEPLRRNPAVAACKGIYRSEQKQLVARLVQLEYEDKYDLLRGQESIDFIDTYSAAYRRDALAASGGFDENVFYVEDQELSFRLAAAGCRMVFQPEAVVYHMHADSVLAYARKKFFIGYWKAKVVGRHPTVAVKDSHTPQVIKLQMLLVLVLAGSVAAAAALAALGSVTFGLALVGLVVAAFVASCGPFMVKAWRKDKAVALAAPALLAVRAGALTAGYVKGTLALLAGRTLPELHSRTDLAASS
jgi:cellulose synthase/poly-beta-1,6-N-acetylglucosamine synthase-like glycosyltransferase